MSKRGESANTRSGGQPAETKMRRIVANPQGSREERRAARKLKITRAPKPFVLTLPPGGDR